MQRVNQLSELQIPDNMNVAVPCGALDGKTIMRYAHVYRDRVSGGVEQYLRHLDHGLLQRHRLTIIQMHLVKDDNCSTIDVENDGLGRILWVPVPVRLMDPSVVDLPNRVAYVFGRTLRLYRQQGEATYQAALPSMWNVLRHRGGHLRYKTTILSDYLSRLLARRDIDLLSLHWLSYDTEALIARVLKAGIPFVFINHFDNLRLPLAQTQKEIAHAAAVGVVSSQSIPEELSDRCVNLSDAVDTEFFSPEKAQLADRPERQIILLPARIQEGKGHRDLLEVARIAIAKNVDFTVCFAGAVDSEPLYRELRTYVAAVGLDKRVLFLGEMSAGELRDWYAKSTLVVLPSYSEGLGRVLIEAQAMKKPVVAYDSGGIREAVLPNETGFLTERGNVTALEEKINYLIHNEAERLSIGQHGREFVSRKFSVAALIQRHERFYLNALSGSRERGKSSRPIRKYVRGRRPAYAFPLACPDATIAVPLVSVLIPAYNAQEWIADTIRSAMAQTWQRKEIIVVDDGSTDETVAIARQFESDSVHVVEQKNEGAAAARNKAFSFCRGDYIQWLDADDLLAPDKIARQMKELGECGNKKKLLSSAWGLFMYRHYRAEFSPTELWCDLSPTEWLLRKMGQNLYMQSASWLVSRELTEAAGPWDTRLLSDDDGEYFCRVLLASDGVRFVPEARMYYRGPGLAFRSLSYIGQSSRKLEAHWLSMRLHIAYVRSLEDSDRVRAACLRYLQTSLIYFYPDKHEIIKQAEDMARELGGDLGPPSLSWKYSWMKTMFGWHVAKHGQQMLLSCRWWLERISDKALFLIDGQDPMAYVASTKAETKTF